MIQKVINGGYCIGCGSCAVYDISFFIKENDIGMFTASYDIDNLKEDTSEVCPFSAKNNEDVLSKNIFNTEKYDKRIGYYIDLFAGYVKNKKERNDSSSGGIVTWVLQELFLNKEIDGVIHVGYIENSDKLFSYKVSKTIEEIKKNRGSAYYPVHFNEALDYVKNNRGKYAFVGVPCFVKAIRLLAEKDVIIKDSIIYTIALFCGHFKTKSFAEMIGWQLGVNPKNLTGIKFRVKKGGKPANQYAVSVLTDHQQLVGPVEIRSLYGMDWGLGYFKPKACDWCDDITGETADLSCGDAWLPKFTSDSLGTSILVVRNNKIQSLLIHGYQFKKIHIEEISASEVYQSQSGNYRHRRDGLLMRIKNAEKLNVWHPVKRKNILSDSFLERDKEKIYIQRERLARRSHIAFDKAKERKNFFYFLFLMLPHEIYYFYLNKRLVRMAGKYTYLLLKYSIRKMRSNI